MDGSLKNKKPHIAKTLPSTIKGDQKRSKLITIQSVFQGKNKAKIRFMQASEAIIFEKLPVIRSLFDLKLNGKPLHSGSKIGRSEKFWAIELGGIEQLASFFGNTEMKEKAVRSTLISYMRQVPTVEPARLESRPSAVKRTANQLKAPETEKVKRSDDIDLTDNNTATLQKRKGTSQSITIPKKLKKVPLSTSTSERLPSMRPYVNIQLNESYPRFLRVHIETASQGSKLIGYLLQDLQSGAFATGDMSKLVGKDRDGRPTLLWDEVLEYFKKPGSVTEKMLSWDEDVRCAPMMMFVERCQLDRALWQGWDERDLWHAEYFDAFVKARVRASDV
ncbi:hypothetical protein SBOR_8990 [Sclerotinia borealis F-4128]|uniref:Uncharacterized protein n=1 Tax=Sclerotinia borealis (strain F-4128) TaxID=1432307 RepID=W9C1E0_SCLBF|nr:hypothetical protein SBOR_8990 [Sclerotinia borealis F-4128]